MIRLIAASAVAMAALVSTAAAQEFPDQSHFQKVTLNDRPGEPMSLAVLPDGRVLHSARTGEIRLHDPRTGTNNIVTDFKQGPKGLYQHDEEGVQGMALDPNFEENHWVYVYYAPKLNTPTDVIGTGINEGDAPETLDNPSERARLAAVRRLQPTLAVQVQEQQDRLHERAGDPARQHRRAGSAATWAARSTSTATATCTCRPVTTPTRSSPPASRRSTTGRIAIRPSTRAAGGQHERPARQDPAHPRPRRRQLLHPAGQPVPSGPVRDAGRDLRHGRAQPVPLLGQPGQRRPLPRRLLAGLADRRTRCAGPRAPGAG